MAFIDRSDCIQRFKAVVDPASPRWLLTFHGLSGAGKTSLLRELHENYSPGLIVPWIDFDQGLPCTHPTELFNALEEALETAGLRSAAWKKYKSACAKIDRWIHNQQIRIHQQVTASGGSVVSRVKQEIDIAVDRKEWERNIELHAAQDRMQALLELCEEMPRQLVLFVDHWDTFEKDGADDYRMWVMQGVILALHKILPRFRVVLASDRPLEGSGLAEGVDNYGLSPFSSADASLLMSALGLSEPGTQQTFNTWAAGNPLLISLAVELWKLDPALSLDELAGEWSIRAASDWLLQRIIERLPDPRSRNVLERGVILRRWTLGDLIQVCERPDLDPTWYRQFTSYPFVQNLTRQTGCKTFVRTVREIQIAQLWMNLRSSYYSAHTNAYNWYSSQLEQQKGP